MHEAKPRGKLKRHRRVGEVSKKYSGQTASINLTITTRKKLPFESFSFLYCSFSGRVYCMFILERLQILRHTTQSFTTHTRNGCFSSSSRQHH